MKPVLLCYNLRGDKASRIFLTAMRMHICVRRVHACEYGLTLRQLCDTQSPAEPSEVPAPFEEEMLVMADFPQGLMQTFLQGMRRAGAAPVYLKAVLTPTNAGWDSVTLHTELSREDAAMRGTGESIHRG